MPFATVNSVRLHYEVLGGKGPWVAFVSGARRSMEEVRALGQRVADAGFSVLLHDRRNTGQSDVSIDGEGSEFEIWADDLHALATHLELPSLVVGGSSSGCRLATIMALRHRQSIRGLVMMRVTGGAYPVRKLSNLYYMQYVEAAERGGMAAVCETDHFRDMIAIDPRRRSAIMGWDKDRFVATMIRWCKNLESGIDDPMLGATEAELRSIDFPVIVLPGNDLSHSIAAGLKVHSLIPGAELREVRKDQLDIDLLPLSEWFPEHELAQVIVDFLKRRTSP
jgi:pimeloyl-ACP methyl ester carboxylesterase